ncbi:MAG TPA: hypothetical protein VFM55_04570 [Micromonosporaceae bacterium]|nr:hypothetical protein [Micromonosporaceae bacterium]
MTQYGRAVRLGQLAVWANIEAHHPGIDTLHLQPLLAAAGYLVNTLGPHAGELSEQVRDADRNWSHRSGAHTPVMRAPTAELVELLNGYENRGQPLPLLAEYHVQDRLASGWSPTTR